MLLWLRIVAVSGQVLDKEQSHPTSFRPVARELRLKQASAIGAIGYRLSLLLGGVACPRRAGRPNVNHVTTTVTVFISP